MSASAVSNQQTGQGVTYSNTKQVRDFFLDQTYRKESGRNMFYEVSMEVMEEVESLLGELNGEAFQITLTDFWTAVQELSKDPSSSVTQGLFVQRASELVESATALYESLCNYQDNLNSQVKNQVNKINEYGMQLVSLNNQICSIESGGIEHANDLRDARNQILDELSELVNMSWSEDQYGNVSVRIEGVDFVSGGICYEIGLQMDETTGFYTPFWPQNADYTILSNGQKEYVIEGAEVFDLDTTISTDMDTDIGGLKAVLLARGDHRADYTDISSNTYEEISQSILMNIQAEFDQLIHNVITAVNSILASSSGLQTGDLTLSDGSILKDVQYCKSEPEGYLRNEDGSPIQIFTKITTDAYEKVQAGAAVSYQGIPYYMSQMNEWVRTFSQKFNDILTSGYDAEGREGTILFTGNQITDDEQYLFPDGSEDTINTRYDLAVQNKNSVTVTDDDSYYQLTAKNFSILKSLESDSSLLANKYDQADGMEQNDLLEDLKDMVYDKEQMSFRGASASEFLQCILSDVALNAQRANTFYQNYSSISGTIDNQRLSVAGVDEDEEAINLVKYQNAYNLASKMIQTLVEVYDRLILETGV